MLQALLDIIGWLEPRALVLAVLLPPLIRISGNWIPEGLFMVAMGVMAARAASPLEAATLLAAVTLSHFASDQTVHAIGRWLRPRLSRFAWAERRLGHLSRRLESNPAAIWGLVPARVLPSGRLVWLLGSGVAAVPWLQFVVVDASALAVHLVTWCGLGWWVAGDLSRLDSSAAIGRVLAPWVLAAVAAALAVLAWRRRAELQLATSAAVRRIWR